MNEPVMKDIADDEDVKTLVHVFYDKVQQDERLGYIFNDYADVDWDHHLPRMVDFWSNLLFQTRRYHGRPFRQHLPYLYKKMILCDGYRYLKGQWTSILKVKKPTLPKRWHQK